MDQKFELLPHTTDAFISAGGTSLEEVFENAALGMFDVMTDTTKIQPSRSEPVEVTGHDERELLYNWLETLLVRFETNQMVYSGFDVKRIERMNGLLRLTATISGEPFDRAKHPARVEVKAVTYHQMSIERKNGLVQARFILDL